MEDDREIRDLLAHYLRREGFDTVLAADGESGLSKARSGKPNLILLDIFLVATHNMQQAARISDSVAFFLLGQPIEMGTSAKIFTNPSDRRTEEYITGRFG